VKYKHGKATQEKYQKEYVNIAMLKSNQVRLNTKSSQVYTKCTHLSLAMYIGSSVQKKADDLYMPFI
jgi:hypothetical protein